ncbi:MAG: HAD-IIB family hydrolase [Planctomycetota bacterium]
MNSAPTNSSGSKERNPMAHPWLFTDLDGTLIPLDKHPDTVTDLEQIRNLVLDKKLDLAYVTGRHFASALEAIDSFDLPIPRCLICNVGTEIYRAEKSIDVGLSWRPNVGYSTTLSSLLKNWTTDRLESSLAGIEGLTKQEDEKLSQFKLSFYVQADQLPRLTELIEGILFNQEAPFSVVGSVDPFNGDGLIDLLPDKVNKAFAVNWLAGSMDINFSNQVIYAGDSGNDLAMLAADCRAILVANAADIVRKAVTTLRSADGRIASLFVASKPATSGVLEGLQAFEVTGS